MAQVPSWAEPIVYRDATRLHVLGLAPFFDNPTHSDITLVLPNGSMRRCHRLVLAICSPLLASIVSAELPNQQLPIAGADSDALDTLLRFMYSGDCELRPETVVPVYDAVTKLEVNSMVLACQQYLRQTGQPPYVASMLNQAVAANQEPLIRMLLELMEARYEEVVSDGSFKELSNEALAHFLGHHRQRPLQQLLDAANSWCSSDPARLAVAQQLLSAHLQQQQSGATAPPQPIKPPAPTQPKVVLISDANTDGGSGGSMPHPAPQAAAATPARPAAAPAGATLQQHLQHLQQQQLQQQRSQVVHRAQQPPKQPTRPKPADGKVATSPMLAGAAGLGALAQHQAQAAKPQQQRQQQSPVMGDAAASSGGGAGAGGVAPYTVRLPDGNVAMVMTPESLAALTQKIASNSTAASLAALAQKLSGGNSGSVAGGAPRGAAAAPAGAGQPAAGVAAPAGPAGAAAAAALLAAMGKAGAQQQQLLQAGGQGLQAALPAAAQKPPQQGQVRSSVLSSLAAALATVGAQSAGEKRGSGGLRGQQGTSPQTLSVAQLQQLQRLQQQVLAAQAGPQGAPSPLPAGTPLQGSVTAVGAAASGDGSAGMRPVVFELPAGAHQELQPGLPGPAIAATGAPQMLPLPALRVVERPATTSPTDPTAQPMITGVIHLRDADFAGGDTGTAAAEDAAHTVPMHHMSDGMVLVPSSAGHSGGSGGNVDLAAAPASSEPPSGCDADMAAAAATLVSAANGDAAAGDNGITRKSSGQSSGSVVLAGMGGALASAMHEALAGANGGGVGAPGLLAESVVALAARLAAGEQVPQQELQGVRRRARSDSGKDVGGGTFKAVAAGSTSTATTSTTTRNVCNIDNCYADLTGLRDYHQRFRICDYHLKLSCILREGHPQRFCQQCGRFHLLSEFDGNKRSCRTRLQQHNARRRKRTDTTGGDEGAVDGGGGPLLTAGGSSGGGRSARVQPRQLPPHLPMNSVQLDGPFTGPLLPYMPPAKRARPDEPGSNDEAAIASMGQAPLEGGPQTLLLAPGGLVSLGHMMYAGMAAGTGGARQQGSRSSSWSADASEPPDQPQPGDTADDNHTLQTENGDGVACQVADEVETGHQTTGAWHDAATAEQLPS